ncbi:competence type IV pilus minor pilin ComGF [Peribacillus castrilensis]|uniref:Competence type IV pilus minor pilin ComGF n=2 Tax=Peribacillus TaxID=2675229 RepID=A0AAJ1QQ82_9BACI|nr:MULTISPECIES: competence type IV pilus minor pilin ComGF [Bacillaceae]MCD1161297.1 ComGF family competence protein [Peribacillus castrilensis]QYF85103.1 ComGF family competence protein [Brevibacterium sp. PAMC21349]MBD8587747.1 ComGF family competence protein [Peribacillus simplex]MCF7623472.1 ComGF family competence protein [Peribacillus frigoritolerans]MCM3167733.1 ComGF family competence protein [Peribacillus frigoritolerans]
MKMKRVIGNPFVMLQKNDGFTMIELLFSLLILMTTSLFVLQLFSIIHTQMRSVDKLHPKEWEVFTMQMKQEVRSSKAQDVMGNKLYLLSGEQLSSLEQYEDKVRRRVDGMGHEVILQNISEFRVDKDGSVIVINITDKAGTTFSRRFHPFFRNDTKVDE